MYARHVRLGIRLTVVAVVLVAAHPAFADEPPQEPSSADRDEARRLFREAVTREDSGDHQGALKLYEDARTHAVSPQLLFNIANCEERLQRLLEAMKTFREAEAESLARGNDEVLRVTRSTLTQANIASSRARPTVACSTSRFPWWRATPVPWW